MKGISIVPASEEETKLIEAFIQEHKLEGFKLEDSKATENDYFNDLIRLLIPLS